MRRILSTSGSGEHKVFEIPGGHEVLYTDPDSLARALAAIAHDLDAR